MRPGIDTVFDGNVARLQVKHGTYAAELEAPGCRAVVLLNGLMLGHTEECSVVMTIEHTRLQRGANEFEVLLTDGHDAHAEESSHQSELDKEAEMSGHGKVTFYVHE
jgi:hypothetical protein